MKFLISIVALMFLCNCSMMWNNPDVRYSSGSEYKCNSSIAPYILDSTGIVTTSTLAAMSAVGDLETEIHPQAVTTILSMILVAYTISLVTGAVEDSKCVEPPYSTSKL